MGKVDGWVAGLFLYFQFPTLIDPIALIKDCLAQRQHSFSQHPFIILSCLSYSKSRGMQTLPSFVASSFSHIINTYCHILKDSAAFSF